MFSALEWREKNTTQTCLILWKTPLLVLMSASHKWRTLSGQELPDVAEESRAPRLVSSQMQEREVDSILVADTDGVLNIDGADAGRTGRDSGQTGRKHLTVLSRFDSTL